VKIVHQVLTHHSFHKSVREMSDARAKAEARRAKILARDSSKKVQAIGDDVSDCLK
jgi:hypothetical protein